MYQNIITELKNDLNIIQNIYHTMRVEEAMNPFSFEEEAKKAMAGNNPVSYEEDESNNPYIKEPYNYRDDIRTKMAEIEYYKLMIKSKRSILSKFK